MPTATWTSFQVRTSRPATLAIRSPAFRPARSAGEPGSIQPTTGASSMYFTTFVPIPLTTDIKSTARTRFMTEPMTMIRNLRPRDLAIMSSGGMGRSFSKTPSPSIWT